MQPLIKKITFLQKDGRATNQLGKYRLLIVRNAARNAISSEVTFFSNGRGCPQTRPEWHKKWHSPQPREHDFALPRFSAAYRLTKSCLFYLSFPTASLSWPHENSSRQSFPAFHNTHRKHASFFYEDSIVSEVI